MSSWQKCESRIWHGDKNSHQQTLVFSLYTAPDQNDFLDETPIMGIHGHASYHRGETIGSRTLQICFGGYQS